MNPAKPAGLVQRRLRTLASRLLLSDGLERLRLARIKRRFARGRVAELPFFFSFDDPYFPTAAPAVLSLANRYRVRVEWLPTFMPMAADAPQGAQRKAYALQDARRETGLDLKAPAAEAVRDAARMAAALPDAERGAWIAEMAGALWLGKPRPADVPHDVQKCDRILAANAAKRARLKHYDSGMILFAGEWFWVFGRMDYLEERLTEAGLDLRSAAL